MENLNNENKLLIEFYNKNPFSILEKKQYIKGEGKHTEYNIFSWISGDDKDIWVNFAYLGKRLEPFNLTVQLYYDIVVLRISNIQERPKCRHCGKPVRFKGMSRGYFDFCNLSCTAKWGNKVPSKIANVSKALTGKKLTKEHKEACSRGAIRRLIKYGIKSSGYYSPKKGKYTPQKSKTELNYDSSWELEFMKLCDNDKFIVSIERVDFSIKYIHNGIEKNYLPDFKITLDSGLTIIIEIKPKRLLYKGLNLKKKIAGKIYCHKHNYKYVCITEDQLFSKNFSIFDFI